jgi:hypothetical protein
VWASPARCVRPYRGCGEKQRRPGPPTTEAAPPGTGAGHSPDATAFQRIFNTGSRSWSHDYAMDIRLARVGAAQFTASGPEDYADYADCDADPRRHSPRAQNIISAGRTDLASQPSPRSTPTSIRLGPTTGRPGQQGTTLPTLRKRLTEQLHDSDGRTVPHRRQNRRTTKRRCRRFRSGNSR